MSCLAKGANMIFRNIAAHAVLQPRLPKTEFE